MKKTFLISSLTLGLSCLTYAQTETKEPTLSEQLLAREKAGSGKVTKEMKTAFKKGIEATRDAKIVENAKSIGDKAPAFTLKNAIGKNVTLADELKKGPVVLTWYRGGW